jgi:hypothetical protein
MNVAPRDIRLHMIPGDFGMPLGVPVAAGEASVASQDTVSARAPPSRR